MEEDETVRRLGEAMAWVRFSAFFVYLIIMGIALYEKCKSKGTLDKKTPEEQYVEKACCSICFDDFKDDE